MSEMELTLEQAMRAFVTASTSGTLESTSTFVQHYPEAIHPELLDFIEEYLLLEVEPMLAEVPADVLAATTAAVERALWEVVEPAPSLTARRKEAGLMPGKLARAVNLPTDFLGLLERGGVQLITIPIQKARLLVDRLAEALNCTTEEIWKSLRAPVLASGVRLSAEDGSTLEVEEPRDFALALRQSAELTPAMRAEWLDELLSKD